MNWDKIQDKLVKMFVIFTTEQFKKLLNKIKELLKQFTKEKNKKANNKTKDENDTKPEYTEETQNAINEELDNLAKEQEKMMYSLLFMIAKKVINSKKIIDRIIKSKWTDIHYSERIKKDKTKLKTVLKLEIEKAIKQKKDINAIIKIASKKCDVSIYQAKRLIDTELSNVLNQSIIEKGKLLRKKRYKIVVTMDERTSDICKKIHRANRTFDINEPKVPGENWVPAHPHCRSRIVYI